MNYRTIFTIKESEKATVELADVEGLKGPAVVKRLKGANADIYRLLCCTQNFHIPRVFFCEEQSCELLVAEEYVDGENLGELLQKRLISDEQKINYALQLCEAVGFLHALKPTVIHRDIKLSNILINGKNELKLIDFDASRQYKNFSNEEDTRLLGTKGYAAPEQFGYSQTDVRSDIYSMGVVFHKMCPLENKVLAKQWDKIAEKCTSFDPKNRYQNVAELKRELEKLAAWKKARRIKNTAWIGSITVVLVVAALVAVLWPKETEAGNMDGITVTTAPTDAPTLIPTSTPTLEPTATSTPTPEPTATSTPTPEPTATSTPTPEPTATNTPMPTATSIPTPTTNPDLSKVPTSINQHYYKSMAEETELILKHGSDTSPLPVTWSGECYDYVTGKNYSIPMDEIEIGPGYIRLLDSGLMQLEPSIYELTITMHYASRWPQSTSRVLKIYSEDEYPKKSNAVMATGTNYFYLNDPTDLVKNVLSTVTSKFVGVSVEIPGMAAVEVDSDWYEILCDGKVMIIQKEFLQQYYENDQKINLIYHFDDGKNQTMVINYKETR